MAQILDPLPQDQESRILCCYVNATNQIQIARITNIDNWYFERVVFPGQRLVFEALPEALLEIHTTQVASAILSDTIPCDRLCVDEGNDSNSNFQPEPNQVKTDNRTKIEVADNRGRIDAKHLKAATNFTS